MHLIANRPRIWASAHEYTPEMHPPLQIGQVLGRSGLTQGTGVVFLETQRSLLRGVVSSEIRHGPMRLDTGR